MLILVVTYSDCMMPACFSFAFCTCRCEDIVEGEPAELLVLCQDERFVNFKVRRVESV